MGNRLSRFIFALSLSALALFCQGAHAQSCNDPSGFLKSYGPMAVGDVLALGPDCQHLQTTGSSAPGGYFNVQSCGATGNGTTDDTAAIQLCITEAQAVGGLIFFPPGSYKVTSQLVATGPISIAGVGYAGWGASTYTGGMNTTQTTGYLGSVIVCSITIDCFSGTSNSPFHFSDIQFTYPNGGTSSFAGHQAITINSVSGGTNANIGTTFKNVMVQGADFSIVLNDVYDFVMDNVDIIGQWMGGIQINAVNNPDFGDSTIINSTFWANGVANHTFHLQVNSGGGLRVLNSKFNYGGTNTYCIKLSPSLTVSQNIEPYIIANNSMEACAIGIGYVNNNVSNATISQGAITGNQIWAGIRAIYVTSNGTGKWINGGNITGNFLQIVGAAAGQVTEIDNWTNLNVGSNTFQCSGGCTGNSVGMTIHANVDGTFGPSNFGSSIPFHYSNSATSGVVIDDPQGVLFANLPATPANGSRIFVTDGTPASSPCTGSSTGSTAFRQNGAWKCF